MNKTYVPIGFVLVFLVLTVGIFYTVKNRTVKSQITDTTESVVDTPVADTIEPTSGTDIVVSSTPIVTNPTSAPKIESTPVPTVDEISLVLTSPKDGLTVVTPTITVTGKTAPNAEVFVNDMDAVADRSGNFSVKLALEEGDNMIVVVANSADGKFAEQEVTVTYTSGS